MTLLSCFLEYTKLFRRYEENEMEGYYLYLRRTTERAKIINYKPDEFSVQIGSVKIFYSFDFHLEMHC